MDTSVTMEESRAKDAQGNHIFRIAVAIAGRLECTYQVTMSHALSPERIEYEINAFRTLVQQKVLG